MIHATMTATTATEPTDPPQPSPSTDAQLISQLATLQSLHDQIFQLRSLLPERLLDPIKAAVEASRSGHEPPAVLASHLRSVAVDGDRNVKEFKEQWRGEGMRDVWAKAKGASFPQGSDVWAVDYRDVVQTVEGDGANDAEVTEGENVDEVLEKCKAEYPKIQIERQANKAGELAVEVTVATQTLVITKAHSVEDVPDGNWLVAPKPGNQAGMTYKCREMVQSLHDRPNKRSLKYLLVSAQVMGSVCGMG